jgi:hypothetical protein
VPEVTVSVPVGVLPTSLAGHAVASPVPPANPLVPAVLLVPPAPLVPPGGLVPLLDELPAAATLPVTLDVPPTLVPNEAELLPFGTPPLEIAAEPPTCLGEP